MARDGVRVPLYMVMYGGLLNDSWLSFDSDQWYVLLPDMEDPGSQPTAVEKYDKKRRAVNRAKDLADDNGNRAGYIVFDKFGRQPPRVHLNQRGRNAVARANQIRSGIMDPL